MSFEAIDSVPHRARFPGLQLAWQVLAGPVGSTAVLNASNEVAVAAFLDRRIRFDQIYSLNAHTLSSVQPGAVRSIDDLLALDTEARGAAARLAQAWSA